MTDTSGFAAICVRVDLRHRREGDQGRHGPHVGPVAATEAGGRSWFTTVG